MWNLPPKCRKSTSFPGPFFEIGRAGTRLLTTAHADRGRPTLNARDYYLKTTIFYTKNYYLRKARANNTNYYWSSYRKLRNTVTAQIRKAKSRFTKNLLANSGKLLKEFRPPSQIHLSDLSMTMALRNQMRIELLFLDHFSAELRNESRKNFINCTQP